MRVITLLNDPFSDEEEGDLLEQILVATTEMSSEGDKPKSLAKAQRSPEWLEWEHVVREELDQLHKKGTWILVEKPADAIPISNRWVFVKKYNKYGDCGDSLLSEPGEHED